MGNCSMRTSAFTRGSRFLSSQKSMDKRGKQFPQPLCALLPQDYTNIIMVQLFSKGPEMWEVPSYLQRTVSRF